MGESARKVGEKLEGFGEILYQKFGWEELLRDKEIKCNKSAHKNSNGNQNRTHGIDLYHKYKDPYRERNIGIITECKNYAWSSINTCNMQKWLDQLIKTIECAQVSEEIREQNKKCDITNTGVLLVHANDGNYKDKEFRDYLTALKYKTKKNNILNIFIASNYEIERWDSMYEYLDKNIKQDDNFNFYYPSVMGSELTLEKHITLDQLFSDFIFIDNETTRVEEDEYGEKSNKKIKQSIVISFDKVTSNAIEYLCDMFKELQLERPGREYVFCFYPETIKDVEIIEDKFKPYIRERFKKKRIKVVRLRNKNLSPVDFR